MGCFSASLQLDVLAAFLQHENGTSVDLTALQEEVILSLATSLKTNVKSNMRLKSVGPKSTNHFYQCISTLSTILGNESLENEPSMVHRPLDITAMTNAAVLFGTRWRSRKIRRKQIALWRKQGIWTERLDHLVEVTIPKLQAIYSEESKQKTPNRWIMTALEAEDHWLDTAGYEETKEPYQE